MTKKKLEENTEKELKNKHKETLKEIKQPLDENLEDFFDDLIETEEEKNKVKGLKNIDEIKKQKKKEESEQKKDEVNETKKERAKNVRTTKGTKKRLGEKYYETEEGKRKMNKLYEGLKSDMSLKQACYWADLDYISVINRKKDNEEIRNNIKRYKEYAFMYAKRTLSLAAMQGDRKAAVEFLKRRDRRYSDKGEVEHSGVQPITEILIKRVNLDNK